MKQGHLSAGVIVAGMIVLAIGGRASAAEVSAAAPTDSSRSIATFDTASTVNAGEFRGKVVWLSCDSKGADRKTQDQQGRPDYALVLQGDDAIHPLMPGTAEVRRQLSSVALEGATVVVDGKYYPNTGVILVSRIAVQTPGLASKHQPRGWWSGAQLDGDDQPRLARCASY